MLAIELPPDVELRLENILRLQTVRSLLSFSIFFVVQRLSSQSEYMYMLAERVTRTAYGDGLKLARAQRPAHQPCRPDRS